MPFILNCWLLFYYIATYCIVFSKKNGSNLFSFALPPDVLFFQKKWVTCSLLQMAHHYKKRFTGTLHFFLGADQKLTCSYKWSAVTVASDPPLEMTTIFRDG
jgi:hypothetical protein